MKSFKKTSLILITLLLTMMLMVSCGDTDEDENTTPPPKEENVKIDMISIDKARTIALKDAGLEENQVIFGKSAFDNEDNAYEIAFYRGTQQYDYELDKKGKIISGEKEALDTEYVSGATPKKSEESIGEKAIREAVLKDSNLKEADVVFIGIESETNNGDLVYTVQYISKSDNTKTTYLVNGTTGEIIK
ncbi:MAG: PepSY domain-containing protein [Anaerovoracaceae bacterium]